MNARKRQAGIECVRGRKSQFKSERKKEKDGQRVKFGVHIHRMVQVKREVRGKHSVRVMKGRRHFKGKYLVVD